MSNTITYEASVYSRTVNYRNFKGEEKTQTLYFALDPIQLMQIIADFVPKKIKSGNPARRDQDAPIDAGQQLKMVKDLAVQSAGEPTEDGEAWISFDEFESSMAGKAFLTKLTSSDGDRREFTEKVVLAPFRAFVQFALADPTNTDKDKQVMQGYLKQLENIFVIPEPGDETIEEKRARLAAEMAALNEASDNVSPMPLPSTDS